MLQTPEVNIFRPTPIEQQIATFRSDVEKVSILRGRHISGIEMFFNGNGPKAIVFNKDGEMIIAEDAETPHADLGRGDRYELMKTEMGVFAAVTPRDIGSSDGRTVYRGATLSGMIGVRGCM